MTALARLTNGHTLPALSNWIEDWFGRDLMQSSSMYNTGVSMPAVNIQETGEEFLVEVAAPGMEKSDFNINLDNNLLTISCEKEMSNEDADKTFTRREFSYTSFQRAFTLPESVDGNNISAKYDNGILNISLPKKDEAKRKPAKQIAIK